MHDNYTARLIQPGGESPDGYGASGETKGGDVDVSGGGPEFDLDCYKSSAPQERISSRNSQSHIILIPVFRHALYRPNIAYLDDIMCYLADVDTTPDLQGLPAEATLFFTKLLRNFLAWRKLELTQLVLQPADYAGVEPSLLHAVCYLIRAPFLPPLKEGEQWSILLEMWQDYPPELPLQRWYSCCCATDAADQLNKILSQQPPSGDAIEHLLASLSKQSDRLAARLLSAMRRLCQGFGDLGKLRGGGGLTTLTVDWNTAQQQWSVVKRVNKSGSRSEDRITNEILCLKRFQHRCIVESLGMVNSPLGYRMPLFPVSLAGWFRHKIACKKEKEVFSYWIPHMLQILAGLVFLQKRGYAHRDVKPGNILVSEEGILVLCDLEYTCPAPGPEGYGLSEVRGTLAYINELSILNYPLGECDPNFGNRADAYALGMVCWCYLLDDPGLEQWQGIKTREQLSAWCDDPEDVYDSRAAARQRTIETLRGDSDHRVSLFGRIFEEATAQEVGDRSLPSELLATLQDGTVSTCTA